jgi:ELWxxDGT repeat protein
VTGPRCSRTSTATKRTGLVYFAASDGSGRGLWSTNGTQNNQAEIKDQNNVRVPDPRELVKVSDTLMMFATKNAVWKLEAPGPGAPRKKVKGQVWTDANNNGIREAGEAPVAGAFVTLTAAGGPPGTWTATNAEGVYVFEDVAPGSYFLTFETPTGYQFSPQNQTDDDHDSDPDPATGQTATFVVDTADVLNQDAGLVPLPYGSVGDRVWRDLDDGLQDAGEPGVLGVVVTLHTPDGAMVDSTLTDADGLYQFLRVAPGDYFVQFELPSEFRFSPQNAGPDADDSDADPATGRSPVFTIALDEDRTDVDAGLVPVDAVIGDLAWLDDNADGFQDPSEAGLAGVAVTLHRSDGTPVATTTTDDYGYYWFIDVVPGDY